MHQRSAGAHYSVDSTKTKTDDILLHKDTTQSVPYRSKFKNITEYLQSLPQTAYWWNLFACLIDS